MQNDIEEKDFVDEFLHRKDFASQYSKYKKIDSDAAFARFQKRVGAKRTSIVRPLLRWTAGIAASVAIAVAMGYALGIGTDNGNEANEPFIASITPGYCHAYLTTADGTVVELTGEGANLDSITAMMTEEETAEPVKIVVPRGGEYRVTLSDGTHVQLNSESSLEFPRIFAADSRSVMLKGEAYFEVAHRDDCPFIVDACGVKIKQYGTHFNVQAYDEQYVEVTLLQGSIGVSVADKGESRLTPGRQAVVCGNSVNIHDVDVENVMGWTEGVFRFEDKELGEIADILSRWYDVKIVVEDSIRHTHFTGSLERDEQIADILDAIAEITGMKYNNENSTIKLHK